VTRDGEGKVFCVGLPRTGTTSLRDAVEFVGLRPAMNPLESTLLGSLERGDGIPDSRYDEHDFFQDVPISAFWRQIVELYPRGKFVLTVRPLDQWIGSMSVFTAKPLDRFETDDSEAGLIARWAMGRTGLGPSLLMDLARAHNVAVRNSGLDLLVLDVAAPNAWRLLLSFLDGLVPDIAGELPPFPHVNPRSDWL